MFCGKCGAQLSDTAAFCNKCGNPLKQSINTARPVMRTPNAIINKNKVLSVLKKSTGGMLKILVGILLIVVLIITAITVFSGIKKKTSIYGTWTDANKTITFTFSEDGNLRISGSNNVLGADAFRFTEEDGTLHLEAQGFAAIGVDIEYEISDGVLYIDMLGQSLALYRAEGSGGTEDSAESSDSIGDTLEDWVESAMDAVQVYSLYGTWTDSYGAISFTFSEDGKLSVSGLEDTLAVDAFTFSEVDDDTLQLKADTNNPLLGAVGLNMDYEIEGDNMAVTIAGMELHLRKKD